MVEWGSQLLYYLFQNMWLVTWPHLSPLSISSSVMSSSCDLHCRAAVHRFHTVFIYSRHAMCLFPSHHYFPFYKERKWDSVAEVALLRQWLDGDRIKMGTEVPWRPAPCSLYTTHISSRLTHLPRGKDVWMQPAHPQPCWPRAWGASAQLLFAVGPERELSQLLVAFTVWLQDKSPTFICKHLRVSPITGEARGHVFRESFLVL